MCTETYQCSRLPKVFNYIQTEEFAELVKNKNSEFSTLQNQKELVLKLERNNDVLMQQALKKIERKDSTENQGGDTPLTPSRSGRKANNTSKQNYREDTSEEEDDGEDDSGSPSKGKKGKIFKSKENVKDKRKSKKFLNPPNLLTLSPSMKRFNPSNYVWIPYPG